ncbi:hypothetical protein KAR91_20050 [Candidatus Pacearchaeota archaeon]|nr:hypothetical protein [Candidatus Pacearchaeota archaeon]
MTLEILSDEAKKLIRRLKMTSEAIELLDKMILEVDQKLYNQSQELIKEMQNSIKYLQDLHSGEAPWLTDDSEAALDPEQARKI